MLDCRKQFAAAVVVAVLMSFTAPNAWAQAGDALSSGPSVLIEAVPGQTGMRPAETARLAVVVTVEDGWHVNAHEPLDPFLIPTTLELDLPQGVTVVRMAYPEPKLHELEGFAEKLAVYGGRFVIGVELDVSPDVAPAKHAVPMTLHYQACDDRQCMMPAHVDGTVELEVVDQEATVKPVSPELFEDLVFHHEKTDETTAQTAARSQAEDAAGWQALLEEFEVAGVDGGYMAPTEFMGFLDRAEQGLTETGLLEDKSVWLVVIVVIVGGLLLNLTPCVLPLIPINLAIIGAGAKAGSKRRGFLLGAVYGFGMAAAYGILGLVVVLGLSATFGALNSTIWFNLIIAALFVALAMAMLGVFTLDFSRLQGRLGASRMKGGTYIAAGAMGAVAALLAGACVAPVIISTIVYSQDQYARGNSIALLLPFLIGVGMALPWPFAGAGLSFLPKPGKWMERVKYVFAAVIMAAAAYFAYQAWTLFSDRHLVDREAVRASVEALDEKGWHSQLQPALAEARAEGKPVLIDFWATWCKNCLTMNNTTFKDDEVVARLDDYVKVKFQAEQPNQPETREVLEKFGVIGLPTYVVLKPR